MIRMPNTYKYYFLMTLLGWNQAAGRMVGAPVTKCHWKQLIVLEEFQDRKRHYINCGLTWFNYIRNPRFFGGAEIVKHNTFQSLSNPSWHTGSASPLLECVSGMWDSKQCWVCGDKHPPGQMALEICKLYTHVSYCFRLKQQVMLELAYVAKHLYL